jgi:hypothetical protein
MYVAHIISTASEIASILESYGSNNNKNCNKKWKHEKPFLEQKPYFRRKKYQKNLCNNKNSNKFFQPGEAERFERALGRSVDRLHQSLPDPQPRIQVFQ